MALIFVFLANSVHAFFLVVVLGFMTHAVVQLVLILGCSEEVSAWRIWTKLSSLFACQEDRDILEEKVRSIVSQRRRDRAVRVWSIIVWCVVPFLALWAVHLWSLQETYSFLPFWYASHDWSGARVFLLTSVHTMCVPMMIFGSVCYARPQWATTRVSDVAHICIAAKIILQLCSPLILPDGEQNSVRILFEGTSIVALRILLAVTLGNARLACLLNMLMGSASVAGYWNASEFAVSLFPDHKFSFAFRELVASALVIGLAWYAEANLYSDVRASLQLNESTQAQTTLKTVLSATCDAVLYVDSWLRLTLPSPELAVMLLKREANDALLHTCLCDLAFDSNDETLLKARLPRDVGSAGNQPDTLAPMIQLSLKDSCGSRVACEMFYCAFMNVDDQLCYLVGVRELNEGGREMPPPYAHELPLALPPLSNSSNSDSAHSSSGSNFNLRTDVNDEIAIVVDLFSGELDITDSTDGFRQLGGRSSVEVPFLRWVDGKRNQKKFAAWLFELVQLWEDKGSVPGAKMGSATFRLRPPGLARLKYKAKCVVHASYDADTARITLHDISQNLTGELPNEHSRVIGKKSRGFESL
eukprot:TRINITY_DN2896_c0_g1_i9.p1 TRINITY_DN2896_c0_g1~~TRINITY_DN2896_c0_g1_i9.p1  ORF type:complete len:587 (-),score=53.59 TRINITY_DN2896_c0_g1_i9:228-1988(-)